VVNTFSNTQMEKIAFLIMHQFNGYKYRYIFWNITLIKKNYFDFRSLVSFSRKATNRWRSRL
jgi:hypothetical protein